MQTYLKSKLVIIVFVSELMAISATAGERFSVTKENKCLTTKMSSLAKTTKTEKTTVAFVDNSSFSWKAGCFSPAAAAEVLLPLEQSLSSVSCGFRRFPVKMRGMLDGCCCIYLYDLKSLIIRCVMLALNYNHNTLEFSKFVLCSKNYNRTISMAI